MSSERSKSCRRQETGSPGQSSGGSRGLAEGLGPSASAGLASRRRIGGDWETTTAVTSASGFKPGACSNQADLLTLSQTSHRLRQRQISQAWTREPGCRAKPRARRYRLSRARIASENHWLSRRRDCFASADRAVKYSSGWPSSPVKRPPEANRTLKKALAAAVSLPFPREPPPAGVFSLKAASLGALARSSRRTLSQSILVIGAPSHSLHPRR